MSPERDRIHRVEQACLDLVTTDQSLTFDQVAARTGLSRATLYRNPELRAVIEEHRHRDREAHTLTGLATEINHLRTTIETLASKVRRHEEELRPSRHRGTG